MLSQVKKKKKQNPTHGAKGQILPYLKDSNETPIWIKCEL